jgi:acyl carrier protein
LLTNVNANGASSPRQSRATGEGWLMRTMSDHAPPGPASATAGVRDQIAARLRGECYAVIIPEVEVGPEDHFFELGGDSVMLIRLVALAQQVFQVDVEALPFFQQPTLTVLVNEVLRSRAAAGDEAALLAIVEQVDGMSDEEIALLLGS